MKPTTFIFGAGTSMPFGFPSGEALLRNIGGYLGTHNHPTSPIRLHNYTYPNQALDNEIANSFLTAVNRGTFDSIDRLAQERPEFDPYARLYIAHNLLAEESTKMCRVCQDQFHNDEGRVSYPDANVYRYIWNILCRNGSTRSSTLDELSRHNFIIFNYDRLFEHFMFNSFHYSLGIEKDKSYELVDNLKILHVYGSLGNYQGIPSYNESSTRNKTDISEIRLLRTGMDSLRLLSDTRSAAKSSPIAEEYFTGTQQVVILGFGYDYVNCNFLKEAYINSRKKIGRALVSGPVTSWFGSAMKKRKTERNDIARMLKIPVNLLGDPADDDVQFMRDMVSKF